MDNDIVIPFTYQGKIEPACYRDQKVPSYWGNPLIEALSYMLEKEEVYKRLRICPAYAEEHRCYSLEDRLLFLGHGRRFFEPMYNHFDLSRRFGSLLRDGYVGRNPLNLGYFRETREKLDRAFQHLISNDLPLGFNLGFDMMGISGVGKSRALERACSLYPQIIQHHWYKDRRFTWTQLVWFKLDCPPDGSIPSLCTNFFRQIDMVLGTTYYQNYGIRNKPSQHVMVGYMKTVASNHSLGVLIIDEIQNLKRVKDPRLLDFFVELDNEIGVPVVLVGTPDAEDTLSGDFRRARRSSGQGEMRWNRMQNDVEWAYFLKALWKYQYVQKQSNLTDELSQTMYYESQGITDIAIKLYFLAQRYAIGTKKETLTRGTIQQAAKMGLPSLQLFLEYIRSNNTRKIKAYKDLPLQDIEATYQRAEHALMEHGEGAPAPGNAPGGGQAPPSGTTQEVNAGKTETQNEPVGSLVLATRQQGTNETLPQIVAQGLKKHQIAAYEALKQAGFICNAVEYLVGESMQ
jgi:hypothetical protein